MFFLLIRMKLEQCNNNSKNMMSIPISTKSLLSFLPVVFHWPFQMNRNGCAGLMKCSISEKFLKAFRSTSFCFDIF